MQAAFEQFRSRQVELWAIAFQDLERAEVMAQLVGAGYPILADVDHAVADAYGVFNVLEDQAAAPSVFIVDAAGRIVWSHVGTSAGDWPAPADILARVP